jgi:hypothetical protein
MFVPRTPGGLKAFAFVSLLGLLDACTCGSPPVAPNERCLSVAGAQPGRGQSCEATDECGDHYSCRDVKDQAGLKCCQFIDRACATEADCCEGQTCPPMRKKCFDKYLSCDKDTDCGDLGDRFCETYTDPYGTSTRCRFHTCGAQGACPEGQSCFQGECMASLPCGGTCEPGKACVPSSNTCQDYSSPTGREAAACPMTCAPGFIGTFQDARNLWDSCALPAVQCVCAELPGLRSNDLGRFSAIAAEPGQGVLVSAYDGQYGDLVVLRYGLDGVKQATQYLDGVPAGVPVYGPSGARGGVVAAGPDVGRYSDIAVGGGHAYVSYYDVTNGDLKVAVRAADGTWRSHRVDGAKADLGRFSSIALDPTGKPGVSYFQLGGDSGFNAQDCPAPRPMGATKFITALKFAHAMTATPAAESDWVVKTVACLSRPPPPCDLCVGVCADTGGGAACLAAATACSPACDANAEACVSSNGQAVCAKKVTVPDLQEVPVGVGLFSSLAFRDGDAIIAFMRRTAATSTTPVKGELVGVSVSSANVVGAPVVLDASGDTGWFPEVKIDPGSKAIAVAYHDATSRTFKFYLAPQLQAGVTPETIDNGLDVTAPGSPSFVGTDSALLFTGNGAIVAVYQDPTQGNLKVAKRGTAWAVQAPVATQGAVGFFADAVFTDGKIYASHAKLHARLVQGDAKVDNTLLLEQFVP